MLNQTQSPTQLPIIAGVEIPLDDQGRYNLNALHRAYEAQESTSVPHKRPSEWLKNKAAQELIDEVRNQGGDSILGTKSTTCDVLNVVHGGNAPGTFAHELIAVEYAGWVSAKFRILVNQTFINFRTGKLVVAPQAPKDPLLASIYQANMAVCQLSIEMDNAKQRLADLEQKTEKVTTTLVSATRIIDKKTKCLDDETKRIDDTVQRHEQILFRRDPAKKYSPTHIGRVLGISAQAVNKLLEQAGFQHNLKDINGKNLGWKIAAAGNRYGRQNRVIYDNSGSQYPASISWSEEIVDVLMPLV